MPYIRNSGTLPEKGDNAVARKAKKVSDMELEILSFLWKQGPSKIREIAEELYGESKPSVYGTVQSLLERLEGKGLVNRNRSSFAHIFSAKISQVDFVGAQLKDIADKVCEGSLTPLIMSLVKGGNLKKKEREEIINLINKI